MVMECIIICIHVSSELKEREDYWCTLHPVLSIYWLACECGFSGVSVQRTIVHLKSWLPFGMVHLKSWLPFGMLSETIFAGLQ